MVAAAKVLRAHLRRRYFPITASDNASRAASCNQLLSGKRNQTGLWQQHDNAATETAEPYSSCRNAFPLSQEFCGRAAPATARTRFGLASVKIEDDPTVAQGRHRRWRERLTVVGRSDKRGAR